MITYFQDTDFEYVLLDLYVFYIFDSILKGNAFFKISILIVHCQYIEMQLTFVYSTYIP